MVLNKFNIHKKNSNNRYSNIELLRIVSMLMVLFLHANFSSLGFISDSITSVESFVRVVAEQLCIVCVNVFVLISGWFGIKAKLKGVFSLLFQVYFYSILIAIMFLLIDKQLDYKVLFKSLYLGSLYWFVTAYLILYAFSPVLNTFIIHSSSKQIFTYLLFFFILEFSLGWVFGNISPYNSGYSTISFIGLYVLGRYLNLNYNSIKRLSAVQNFFLYLFFTIIPVIWFLLTGDNRNMIYYTSPFVVFAAMFFFLTFAKFKFENKWINYLACSSFSIYLIHLHPQIWPFYENLIKCAYESLDGLVFIFFVIIFVAVFSLFCMIFDKLRIKLWDFFCLLFLNKLILKIESLFGNLCNRIGV